MNINFKARLINFYPANNVKKLDQNGQLSMVELYPENITDSGLPKVLLERWNGGDKYLNHIAGEMRYYYHHPAQNKENGVRFYGLSTQPDGFGFMKAEKMLGIAQVTVDGKYRCSLDFIETNPKISEPVENSCFSDLWAKFAKLLINYYKNKTITVSALKSEIESYKNFGFVPEEKWVLDNIIKKMKLPAYSVKIKL